MANSPVLNVSDWETKSLRYMQPRISDRGAKTISLISTQTNRSLHLSVPLMMTWGIGDYVNEQGESDGKFSMTLNFPNPDYANEATDEFLEKLKSFHVLLMNLRSNFQMGFYRKLIYCRQVLPQHQHTSSKGQILQLPFAFKYQFYTTRVGPSLVFL